MPVNGAITKIERIDFHEEVNKMSLNLLEENWGSIKNKVIKPLWKYKFCNLYQSVKLDENDFESLAGEALTKAFKNYKANESNIFTYATMVITKKAQTEIRDRKREKRQAEIIRRWRGFNW